MSEGKKNIVAGLMMLAGCMFYVLAGGISMVGCIARLAIAIRRSTDVREA